MHHTDQHKTYDLLNTMMGKKEPSILTQGNGLFETLTGKDGRGKFYIRDGEDYYCQSRIYGNALNSTHPTKKDFDRCIWSEDPTQSKVFSTSKEAFEVAKWLGRGVVIEITSEDEPDGIGKIHK